MTLFRAGFVPATSDGSRPEVGDDGRMDGSNCVGRRNNGGELLERKERKIPDWGPRIPEDSNEGRSDS